MHVDPNELQVYLITLAAHAIDGLMPQWLKLDVLI
jgi:hypothetical protein